MTDIQKEISLESYLGKACRKFRRGVLDMSIKEMLDKTNSHVNQASISAFERGKMKSSYLMRIYILADEHKSQNFQKVVDEAFAEYVKTFS